MYRHVFFFDPDWIPSLYGVCWLRNVHATQILSLCNVIAYRLYQVLDFINMLKLCICGSNMAAVEGKKIPNQRVLFWTVHTCWATLTTCLLILSLNSYKCFQYCSLNNWSLGGFSAPAKSRVDTEPTVRTVTAKVDTGIV